MVNPKSLRNLKAWRRGQSGNPEGGRLHKRTWALLFARLAESQTIGGVTLPEDKTVAEVLAEVLILRALAGDIHAMKLVLDRVDGPVPNPVEYADPVRVTMRLPRPRKHRLSVLRKAV